MLNYSAPICQTGYGYTGYNLLRALLKEKYPCRLFPIGPTDPEMSQEVSPIWYGSGSIKSDKSASLRIYHQYDIHPRIGKGPHFGFPIFELDKFAQHELNSMSFCDYLITCSQWGKKVLDSQATHYSSPPVLVVPLGVDTSVFRESTPPRTRKTIFLCAGKWEIRKGHDFLAECFRAAFNPKDDVELWLMCENPFLKPEQLKNWLNMYNHPKVKILPRAKDHESVKYIMSQADIGIFPARAEGWNLELLEMLSIGRHVITTNYSGHTEFVTKDNAHLIEIDELEPAHDGIWFKGEGNWAKLGQNQFDQTLSYMRELHARKQAGQLGVNINGVITGQKFSWTNSAKKLIEILNNV